MWQKLSLLGRQSTKGAEVMSGYPSRIAARVSGMLWTILLNIDGLPEGADLQESSGEDSLSMIVELEAACWLLGSANFICLA